MSAFSTTTLTLSSLCTGPATTAHPQGEFLGQFKNEHKPGQFGVEFLGAGPKNYGLKLNTGETTLKVRGFTLNELARQSLNYGTVRQLVRDEGFDMTRTINVCMGDTIKRRKTDWSLYTVLNEKTYQLVYNKRYILDDLRTVPWGYLFLEEQEDYDGDVMMIWMSDFFLNKYSY